MSTGSGRRAYFWTRPSFLTLQRGNAVGDAPRHRFALRRRFGTGRGASRTACRRGASAR
ncbi:DUF1534 domain-containing protein [Pseudomonas syringae pv. actinidiae]|nr:DUF1534 domain-containing protein [Pseudomonas syringae pv. actinidiae]